MSGRKSWVPSSISFGQYPSTPHDSTRQGHTYDRFPSRVNTDPHTRTHPPHTPPAHAPRARPGPRPPATSSRVRTKTSTFSLTLTPRVDTHTFAYLPSDSHVRGPTCHLHIFHTRRPHRSSCPLGPLLPPEDRSDRGPRPVTPHPSRNELSPLPGAPLPQTKPLPTEVHEPSQLPVPPSSETGTGPPRPP